jgi:hypothetical protein
MGKKIDIAALKPVVGTLYPPPFDEPCRARERTRLGLAHQTFTDVAALDQAIHDAVIDLNRERIPDPLAMPRISA